MPIEDDLDIEVDDDILTLVGSKQLDQWQAGQIQLRRDLRRITTELEKKIADLTVSPSALQLKLRPRSGGQPVVGSR